MQRHTGQVDTHMWIHRRRCGTSVLLGEAEIGDRRQEKRQDGKGGSQRWMDGRREGRGGEGGGMQRDTWEEEGVAARAECF